MTQPVALKNPLAEPRRRTPRRMISVQGMDGKEWKIADPKAVRALIACMDMTAVIGGAAAHWGGPSAFVEIVASLHALMFQEAKKAKAPYFERFHFVNDAGHCENGIYALKECYGLVQIEDLKRFRSIKGKLAGHGEAHLFPEGVYLSNGPLGSTLGQAQGLSIADKLQGKNRMCVSAVSDGALMEGEAKEALAAIPGFARKGQTNPFLLIISDNNTKLSGPIDKQSFSMAETLKSLKTLGWETLPLRFGNDPAAVFKALQKAIVKARANPKKPVALWAKTRKGFGVKATEASLSGGHGFPLKNPQHLKAFIEEIYKGSPIPKDILSWSMEIARAKSFAPAPSSFVKVQAGVSRALIQQKKKGAPLISISSDLQGSTGVFDFRKMFPESALDVGVAEANMISMAVGFSKQGFIPVVDAFAQFAVTKGALPLMMSALSQAPVIGVFSHAGFQDAADGASHQALSYIAKTQSLPNTRVVCLSSSEEAFRLVSLAVKDFHQKRKSGKTPLSTLFFLGREVFPNLPVACGKRSSLSAAEIVFDNSKDKNPVLIVSFGALIHQALKACFRLKDLGRGAVLINNPVVSAPDVRRISSWLKACKGRLLSLEEHQVKGGFSSLLTLALQERGETFRVKALGVRGGFGRSAYSSQELLSRFGLNAEAVQKAAIELSDT